MVNYLFSTALCSVLIGSSMVAIVADCFNLRGLLSLVLFLANQLAVSYAKAIGEDEIAVTIALRTHFLRFNVLRA